MQDLFQNQTLQKKGLGSGSRGECLAQEVSARTTPPKNSQTTENGKTVNTCFLSSCLSSCSHMLGTFDPMVKDLMVTTANSRKNRFFLYGEWNVSYHDGFFPCFPFSKGTEPWRSATWATPSAHSRLLSSIVFWHTCLMFGKDGTQVSVFKKVTQTGLTCSCKAPTAVLWKQVCFEFFASSCSRHWKWRLWVRSSVKARRNGSCL
jgi:hypothetical protein